MQAYRVYTNEIHLESCGFIFGSSSALWRNSGDCGYLYDDEGTLVSEYCYKQLRLCIVNSLQESTIVQYHLVEVIILSSVVIFPSVRFYMV